MSGMRAEISNKYFWFVVLELLFGFWASVAYIGVSGRGYSYVRAEVAVEVHNYEMRNFDKYYAERGDNTIEWLLVDFTICGAFLPMMFRVLVYCYEKDVSKPPMLTIYLFAAIMYLLGGVVLIYEDARNTPLIRGIIAIICSIFLFIDMIFYCIES